MEYFKITNDKWIQYNPETETTTVIRRPELRDEKQFLRAQLETLKEQPTDAELLAWAKENYPQSGEAESIRLIKEKIAEINLILDATK